MSRKTAVITGASSGIGLELARLFAADDYDLIVSARRVERLQQLADELGKAYGTSVRIIQMDMAQPYAGAALWQAIRTITPDIEVLVNNAGVGDAGDFAGETARGHRTHDPPQHLHADFAHASCATRHDRKEARQDTQRRLAGRFPTRWPRYVGVLRDQELCAVLLARHPSRVARNRGECHRVVSGCDAHRVRGNRQGAGHAVVPLDEADGGARCGACGLPGDAARMRSGGAGIVEQVPGDQSGILSVSHRIGDQPFPVVGATLNLFDEAANEAVFQDWR